MSDRTGNPPTDEAGAGPPASGSELLAELAHELRTPLGAILSFAEVLRDERFGPVGNARYREYAGDVFRAAHHALAIVNAMLDREALASGKPLVETAEVDLNALAAECIAIAAPMADAAGCALVPTLAVPLACVVADPRTLRQILLNLLANAIRLAPRGSRVGISTAAQPDGGIRVTVRDSGPGMSLEEIQRALATPASAQAEQLTRPAAGGGIGLPLVRTLATVNGAIFGLDSRSGEGTTATVTFPLDRVAGA